MHTITFTPNSLPFFEATSTAVSITLHRIALPSLSLLNPNMPYTTSRKPIRLTTKDTEQRCIYCVLLARIGLTPNLIRSEISFLRNVIEAKAGFINKASLALK